MILIPLCHMDRLLRGRDAPTRSPPIDLDCQALVTRFQALALTLCHRLVTFDRVGVGE